MQWFKERTQLGDHDSHYATSYVHGVCTLEITACEPGDSGLFRCSAANPLGSDETTCLLHVEGNEGNSLEQCLISRRDISL